MPQELGSAFGVREHFSVSNAAQQQMWGKGGKQEGRGELWMSSQPEAKLYRPMDVYGKSWENGEVNTRKILSSPFPCEKMKERKRMFYFKERKEKKEEIERREK